MEKASEEVSFDEILERLQKARETYDRGREEPDTKLQRRGALDALALAIALHQQDLPNGAALMRPLIDLLFALKGIDANKPSNLLRLEPLEIRDEPLSANLVEGCVVVQIFKDTGYSTSVTAAERAVAKALGEQHGAFRSWRKHLLSGKYAEQRGLYDDLLEKIRRLPSPKDAAVLILRDISLP